MRVHVLYFAVLRDRLKRDGEELEFCEQPPTAGAAVALLALRHPLMGPLLPRLQIAVNRQMVGVDHLLAEGDELALIPPVAGGSDSRIHITPHPLQVGHLETLVGGPGRGATVTFSGKVRDHGQLAQVSRLEYEAYIPMAEQTLRTIAQEIESRWPGTQVAIHHRIGTLSVGETAVVVAVASPHRVAAFEACRAAIEELKSRAPIWKKEIGQDGAVWIGLGP